MKKTILLVLLVIAVIWTILTVGRPVLLNGEFVALNYFFPMSETKDLVNIESPDHRLVATGYHVIGRATVADSTIVIVHAKNESYLDQKNDPVLIADNLDSFHLSWAQNRLLVVKCSLDNIYAKKSSWHDVTVQYEK
jgi:hypothetical protein